MDYKESYIIGLYIELDYIYRERDREREKERELDSI